MPKVPGEDKYECDCGCGDVGRRVKDQRYECALPRGWIRVKTAPATMHDSGLDYVLGFATVSCFRTWAAETDFPWAAP